MPAASSDNSRAPTGTQPSNSDQIAAMVVTQSEVASVTTIEGTAAST